MEICVKEHYERSFGIWISTWHQYQFNSLLLDEFHDRMLEHVAVQYTGRKGDYKRSLLDFREKYLITEDDLPFKRSEEHTSELQSLMRLSYAVFFFKKKKTKNKQ